MISQTETFRDVISVYADRRININYFPSKIDTKGFNVLIDGEDFFDQPVTNTKRILEKLRQEQRRDKRKKKRRASVSTVAYFLVLTVFSLLFLPYTLVITMKKRRMD